MQFLAKTGRVLILTYSIPCLFFLPGQQQQQRERELRKQHEREQRRRYEEMEQLRREEERRHAEREQVHKLWILPHKKNIKKKEKSPSRCGRAGDRMVPRKLEKFALKLSRVFWSPSAAVSL